MKKFLFILSTEYVPSNDLHADYREIPKAFFAREIVINLDNSVLAREIAEGFGYKSAFLAGRKNYGHVAICVEIDLEYQHPQGSLYKVIKVG